MPSTRIPGITINPAGQRIIDKEHRGIRIYARLGAVSEEEARQRLAAETEHVEQELQRKAARPRFADAAARYLQESRELRTADVAAWHVRLLIPYLGTLELNRIHDRTLERFIADRLDDGVTATTINRSLEIVRTVLNRAARSYRDDDGRPWLEGMPPDQNAARKAATALPDHLGGAGQALSEVACASRSNGAIRGQHGLA